MPSTAIVQQRSVACGVLRRRIGPVREQREVQLAVRGGEIVDLEALDVLLDCRARRQQCGHHDHRSEDAGGCRRAARDQEGSSRPALG